MGFEVILHTGTLKVKTVRKNNQLFKFIFSILIVSTSLFAIIYRDTVNPGLVGLSLTYALTCQLDIFLLTRYIKIHKPIDPFFL